MEMLNGSYFGVCGYLPQIRSKADAMKYAFDVVQGIACRKGEFNANIDLAMQIYKTFVDNINLPDIYEDNQLSNLIEKYGNVFQSIIGEVIKSKP